MDGEREKEREREREREREKCLVHITTNFGAERQIDHA